MRGSQSSKPVKLDTDEVMATLDLDKKRAMERSKVVVHNVVVRNTCYASYMWTGMLYVGKWHIVGCECDSENERLCTVVQNISSISIGLMALFWPY